MQLATLHSSVYKGVQLCGFTSDTTAFEAFAVLWFIHPPLRMTHGLLHLITVTLVMKKRKAHSACAPSLVFLQVPHMNCRLETQNGWQC
eukprot:6465673-Amphidinium_carterae.1